jgi:hypothetical protein
MRTLSVLTPCPISETELRGVVIELGGAWREDYGIHQGIVVRSGAEILLTLDNAVIDECSGDEDLPWPKTQMGFDPKSQVVIGVIRYHNQEQDLAARILSRDVADHLAKKWAGYIDWDDILPP